MGRVGGREGDRGGPCHSRLGSVDVAVPHADRVVHGLHTHVPVQLPGAEPHERHLHPVVQAVAQVCTTVPARGRGDDGDSGSQQVTAAAPGGGGAGGAGCGEGDGDGVLVGAGAQGLPLAGHGHGGQGGARGGPAAGVVLCHLQRGAG